LNSQLFIVTWVRPKTLKQNPAPDHRVWPLFKHIATPYSHIFQKPKSAPGQVAHLKYHIVD
jgi:hypothetical protein